MNPTKFYLFVILLITSTNFAQFKYNIGLGSGFYFTDQSAVYDNSQNYLTGQLKLNYSIKENFRKASLEVMALPEFFGTGNSVKSLKLKVEAEYSEVLNNISWGVSLLKKNYFYTGLGIKNNFDIYFLHSYIDWKIDHLPLKTSVGLAYQDISGTYSQLSDLIYLDHRFFHYFSPFTNLNYGIYVERFSLSSSAKNSGWRYGPVFSLNHLRDFVFNLQLRFILHSSEITSKFSHESIIRLIAGKILTRELSLFILADYSWRNLNYNVESDILPYSLIDSENNINLKLTYSLNSSSEIYLKSGYFNQDYLDRDLSLKGWNILAGFKIGN